MSRARELAKLANPEVFSVDSNNNVGVNSLTPDAKLDIVGVVSATSFSGDGSQLTGIIAGATLSPSNGTQRLVVTSQTTGSMTEVGTNSNITYDTGSSTLSATQFSGSLLGNATGLQGTPSITVQDITAETVSVGGTISYEDVTNIISVGIITANKGIEVPDGGVVVTGVITATSFEGDGSGLSGVESGVFNFVASGTGNSVQPGEPLVINTDGTVSTVRSTGSSSTPVTSSQVLYNSSDAIWNKVVYIGNDKVVICYAGWQGKAVVGTISGTGIDFGTPVTPVQFSLGTATAICATYDSDNNKLVIFYRDSGQTSTTNLYGIVGTISGTTITFGNPTQIANTDSEYTTCTYDTNVNRIVAFYTSGNYPHASICSISQTTLSVEKNKALNTGQSGGSYMACTFDSFNNKVVLAFRDNASGRGGRGTAMVLTASSNDITYGSKYDINGTDVLHNFALTFDSTNNKVIIAYENKEIVNGNYDNGQATLATVSGTAITINSSYVFNNTSGDTTDISATYDSTNDKVIIAYRNTINSDEGKLSYGSVSGTSISLGDNLVFNAGPTDETTCVYVPSTDKVVIAYGDSNNAGYANVFSPVSIVTNLTSENYIGLAAEGISFGSSGKVTTVGGINTSLVGLTAGQTYYVQRNGTLNTSDDGVSIVAGTAVAGQKILVWKN